MGQDADETTDNHIEERFPGPVLSIHYESRMYVPPVDPVSRILLLDYVLYNRYLGTGSGRGLLSAQVDDVSNLKEDTDWQGMVVLTFPSSAPGL